MKREIKRINLVYFEDSRTVSSSHGRATRRKLDDVNFSVFDRVKEIAGRQNTSHHFPQHSHHGFKIRPQPAARPRTIGPTWLAMTLQH